MWHFGREFIIELTKEGWADVGGTLAKNVAFVISGMPPLFLTSSELIFFASVEPTGHSTLGMFDFADP